MESLHNEEQRQILMRFFKTAPGEYGYGDEFLGIKVPQTRKVAGLVARDFPLSEVPVLLTSRWHEVRLCGLLILVSQFERYATKRLLEDADAIRRRDEILTLYLKYAERANNWDLVDLSAPKILGRWLVLPSALGDRQHKQQVLDRLAASTCLHKAVGWMLREMGKQVSMDLLRDFLRQHVREMPRTMLRYAIEKMDEKERKYWMDC